MKISIYDISHFFLYNFTHYRVNFIGSSRNQIFSIYKIVVFNRGV